MENKKCSNKNHSDTRSISYCPECKVYMCNKCSNLHSELFQEHIIYNLNKDINEIFIDICSEPNHKKELEYFCKNHNKLCCVACISKIKNKGNGQHTDCNICSIEDIKDEKKNKLKENIKYLENASEKIENAINEIKKIFEKINTKKEELKLNIQNTFTKIRNILNEREDELLLEVDKKIDKIYFSEDIIKKSEAIPKKIKLYLEKGKAIDNEWNENNKLKGLINDCVNIENNINIIDQINTNLEKYKNENINFQFRPINEELDEYLKRIKLIGEIRIDNNFIFQFRPGNNYSLDKNGLISTKTNGNKWNCKIIGNKPIPKNIQSKWKIRLNNYRYYTGNWNIFIGIGPNNNNNNNTYEDCWCFLCDDSSIFNKSKKKNYYNHSGNLKNGDVVTVIIDRKEGNLSFSLNDKDYGIAFTNIPYEEELYPVVVIFYENNSVEIIYD